MISDGFSQRTSFHWSEVPGMMSLSKKTEQKKFGGESHEWI